MIKNPKVQKYPANVNGINMEKNRQNSFFEKQKPINTAAKHLIDDAKDITDLKEINTCIYKFYKSLLKKNVSKSESERESFLNRIALPNLNSKSFDICGI